MLNNKSVAVVVPAYNEEKQIEKVLSTMPAFVDRIIVVDDCSTDRTYQITESFREKLGKSDITLKINSLKERNGYNHADYMVEELMKKESEELPPFEIIEGEENDRLISIRLKENSGVGGAIARGYKWCKDKGIECCAVMAGDGQMDPEELESIVLPVLTGEADYVKGNRLIHKSAPYIIPRTRFWGNSVLSILTKIASGYWHVSDTQCGYTAISLKALHSIELHKIYRRYGMPNDLLVKLNIAQCRLKEVEIKPVYHIGETSKLKPFRVIPTISWLLIKSFFHRLWQKYLLRNFHPLFILYHIGFLLFFALIPFIIYMVPLMFMPGRQISNSIMFIVLFITISMLQSILFAMWMDIQDNERLYKD
ncbi:MAG: glycosyltransferase [Sphingobacteriales bacterium]|nr:glycosyltransferase [Sphingobacteriales bacterium]